MTHNTDLRSYAFVQRLENVIDDANGVNSLCPAHDDSKNSLNISIGNDSLKLVLHCKAGCDFVDILRASGSQYSDVLPPGANGCHKRNGKPQGKIVATYDYADEQEAILFQVVRTGPKGFPQRHPDGKGGWVWGVKGVRKVLYRLPDLLAADPSIPVYIVEGEKDVDRLRRQCKIIATTSLGGPGKQMKSYAKFLKGRDVVIIPDIDRPGSNGRCPGWDHATQIANSLIGIAKRVCIVTLPNEFELIPKWDTSDWLDAVEATPDWKPESELSPANSNEVNQDRANLPPEKIRELNQLSLDSSEGRTDRSNGRRFDRMCGHGIRFVHPWKKWLV